MCFTSVRLHELRFHQKLELLMIDQKKKIEPFFFY